MHIWIIELREENITITCRDCNTGNGSCCSPADMAVSSSHCYMLFELGMQIELGQCKQYWQLFSGFKMSGFLVHFLSGSF